MPGKSVGKAAAKAEGRKHYLGKLCPAHSTLGGKRYVASSECVTCARQKVDAYRATPRGRAAVLNNARYRKYGVTPAQFRALLKKQGNRCGVCRTAIPGGRDNTWHQDHNHRTGKARGILCARCNSGLGYFRDSPALLQKAVSYLKNSE